MAINDFNEILLTNEKQVKEFYNKCTVAGINVIKLLWAKTRQANASVTGFEIPKFKAPSGVSGTSVDLDLNVTWIRGGVNFNVDKDGRCWAYIADTAINRDILARSFSRNWYRIVDNTLRNELLKLAKEKGYETTIAKKPEINIKISPREKEAVNKVDELTKQIAELQEKLAQANKDKVGVTTNLAEKKTTFADLTPIKKT